jgi:hypothetical protein
MVAKRVPRVCVYKLDIIPVHHTMKAANTAPISTDGAILLKLSGRSEHGEAVKAAVMTYISPDTDSFFLSKEAMIQLRIILHDFPQLGAAFPMHDEPSCYAVASHEPQGRDDSLLADCGCLKRQLLDQESYHSLVIEGIQVVFLKMVER